MARSATNMWTDTAKAQRALCKEMREPPARGVSGRGLFYQSIVRSGWMKQAEKENRTVGMEGLFLIKDLEDAGIDPEIYSTEEVISEGKDKTLHELNKERRDNALQTRRVIRKKCLSDVRILTACSPRWMRCIENADVALKPEVLNASLLPVAAAKKNVMVLFYRMKGKDPKDIADIYKNGIPAGRGDRTRVDVEYCGPEENHWTNGLNNQEWSWECRRFGDKVSCTKTFLKHTSDGDDTIFIIDAQLMSSHFIKICYERT